MQGKAKAQLDLKLLRNNAKMASAGLSVAKWISANMCPAAELGGLKKKTNWKHMEVPSLPQSLQTRYFLRHLHGDWLTLGERSTACSKRALSYGLLMHIGYKPIGSDSMLRELASGIVRPSYIAFERQRKPWGMGAMMCKEKPKELGLFSLRTGGSGF